MVFCAASSSSTTRGDVCALKNRDDVREEMRRKLQIQNLNFEAERERERERECLNICVFNVFIVICFK